MRLTQEEQSRRWRRIQQRGSSAQDVDEQEHTHGHTKVPLNAHVYTPAYTYALRYP